MITDTSLPAVARDLLADLHQRFGLDAWVLTRVVGEDSMVIFSHGPAAPDEGSVSPLANSLEARLLDGGPHAVVDVTQAAYAQVVMPIDGAVSLIGTPVHALDGSLFGCLYGVGGQTGSFTPDEVHRPLSLAIRSLQMVLTVEQTRAAAEPQEPTGRGDVRRDALTGLLNDRGWEDALAVEAERCRRYGNRASIVSVVVDGLRGCHTVPDEVLVRQTGEALRAWRRGADVVARTGDYTFSILLVEAWELDAVNAVARLEQTLAARRINARTGLADNRDRSLVEAVDVAHELAGNAARNT